MKIVDVFFSDRPLGGALRSAFGGASGIGLLSANRYLLSDFYLESHDLWLASFVVQMCALMAFTIWAFPRLERRHHMRRALDHVIKDMEDPNRCIPFSRFIKKSSEEDDDKKT